MKTDKSLETVHTHTHTPIFCKSINEKASLLNKISSVMRGKNQIKENIKIGYDMIRKYIRKKNQISLSFL